MLQSFVFFSIIYYLKKSKDYKLVKVIERSKDTLVLLVVLYQKSYVRNINPKHNGDKSAVVLFDERCKDYNTSYKYLLIQLLL